VPFYGVDLWHAYEMSWLDATGKPLARVGRFSVPASSPSIVESKSFKLYLNSLNSLRFASEAEASATITADISSVAGATVTLELLSVEDPALAGATLTGQCLDELAVSAVPAQPDVEQLQLRAGQPVEETLYSHLLRSLCPVTGQPDWASVWIHYRGKPLDHSALLHYLLAYREHQEFHEQCVERMFRDLSLRCEPDMLQVQAFYTRRGGLDINPFRTTDPNAQALPRLNRQ
jgi:7-cyano-7-deazaguanine reductase